VNGYETFYKGQPSGIMTSRATSWVIVVGHEALITKTDTLRDFTLSGDFREVAAGDNQQSVVRLIPLARLKNTKGVFVVPLPEMAES